MPIIYGNQTHGMLYKVGASCTDCWPATRDATSATGLDASTPLAAAVHIRATAASDTSPYYLYRYFISFDVSGITAPPASATLKVNGYSSGDLNFICLKASKPDELAQIATSDYDAIDGTWSGTSMVGNTTAYTAVVPAATTWNIGSFNDITLNAAALADMGDPSVDNLMIAFVEADYDYLNVIPNEFGGGQWNLSTGWHTVVAGRTRDPSTEMHIDYVAGTSGGTWKYYDSEKGPRQPSHNSRFASSKHENYSSEFTRNTEQVPFSKTVRGPANLRGRNTVHKVTKG